MHIIIVGCGKVGRTLAEQLQEDVKEEIKNRENRKVEVTE